MSGMSGMSGMNEQEARWPELWSRALAWIYSFSDTERTGVFIHDREDNLARERALLARMDNPQRAYGVTHIAGTKGKGSTSAMLANILTAAGLRTGLYTQPDLHTFRERIRLDGQVISAEALVALIPTLRQALAEVGDAYGDYITYEVSTALAFLAFREALVDHAVIEVGLGGRLDATNVVEPMATAITSISYDHMAILGNTLGEIAGEKAGIIKEGIPVVCSAQAPEAVAAIERIAALRNVPLVRVGPEGSNGDYIWLPGAAEERRQFFDLVTPIGSYRQIELALLGEHQIENAAVAVALTETLRARGLSVDETAIRTGLRTVRWPGRMQIVGHEPLAVVDSAHNADSFAHLFAGLHRHFAWDRLLLVIGLMADKDLHGVAAEIALAGAARVYTTAAAITRADAPDHLATILKEAAPTLDVHPTAHAAEALTAALADAGPRDLVCVAGSVYLAGEALRWFAARSTPEARTIEIAGVDHP
ncbi:MAG TPA: folylpolyglutamate synthase/dihydrofolate synthase family protein [Ktedonobacterales bacterium]|nr:folylpolyglutamate synthase/dihydrofolate synthase family protein [Ktedonobacterales bacterium]